MRYRLFLALSSASFVMAGVGIQACGGDTDSGATPTPDAAPDTYSPPVDAADAAPKCDPNKDYLGTIPDASIADGASSTGVCVACVEANCKTQVAACGADCACQAVAAVLLTCYTTTMSVLGCASAIGNVSSTTQANGLDLFSCINTDCKTECATAAFVDGGADGGDAGDGAAP